MTQLMTLNVPDEVMTKLAEIYQREYSQVAGVHGMTFTDWLIDQLRTRAFGGAVEPGIRAEHEYRDE